MADDSSQDRNLPASQRKIDKARREGQVARSRDLGHLGALGLGIALMAAGGGLVLDAGGRLLEAGLRFDVRQLVTPAVMVDHLAAQSLKMMTLLAPVFAVTVLAAVASGVLSGGWNFTMKALEPSWEKVSPLAGIKRLFSLMQLTTTLKACLLALVLGAVGAVYLGQHWMEHAALLRLPLPTALAEGGRLVMGGLVLLLVVLALFALVDVPLQRQLLLRRLRMTVEEMKKEYKEVEGNAEVKAKLKLKMREMASRRMLAAVPKADLVVMNPTHFAVALRYDEATMAAPRVVAKGADLLAMRIRDIARDAHVPVLQAPPLARALYAHCELDAEVPARLFTAVAQVLAWVYQVRDAMAAGRPAVQPAPEPEVPADLDPLNAADERGRRTEDPPL
ncbi:MAG: flagellar biosynthesis protein FlhB [Betaproteobacteria bacterium]|jgi:flagellar biosynthetic protein FlhB|nr:flagellar type III secretion system protein FlhB [Burkholderiaceae bacterium]MCZ8110762.1 flagellar type III secretion system protein FlhB [Rubrivivax sp.]MCZ8177253.1 flagellar type III secretion system protein FlhB [Burkholderiaceae bacterium]